MDAYHVLIQKPDRNGLTRPQHVIYIPKDILVGIVNMENSKGTLVRTTRYEGAQAIVDHTGGVEGKVIGTTGLDPETYDLITNIPDGQRIVINGKFDGSTKRLIEILSGDYRVDVPEKKKGAIDWLYQLFSKRK